MKGRKNNRLHMHDYSAAGEYFITINTKDRVPWFGSLRDGLVLPTFEGLIAHAFFREILDHFHECQIDEFIVMPDHVHGIVVIDSNVGARRSYVGARHAWPLHTNHRRNDELLPVIIGSYKSAVTRESNRTGNAQVFRWQRSFYDRIIRDEEEMDRVRNYIRNNPGRSR